jgi:hypothetical protein
VRGIREVVSVHRLRHNAVDQIGVAFLQPSRGFELLRRRIDERRQLGCFDAALGTSAHHFEIDGNPMQRVSYIMRELLQLGRTIRFGHDSSIAQICVIGCRFHNG